MKYIITIEDIEDNLVDISAAKIAQPGEQERAATEVFNYLSKAVDLCVERSPNATSIDD